MEDLQRKMARTQNGSTSQRTRSMPSGIMQTTLNGSVPRTVSQPSMFVVFPLVLTANLMD